VLTASAMKRQKIHVGVDRSFIALKTAFHEEFLLDVLCTDKLGYFLKLKYRRFLSIRVTSTKR
jgi:hypothetical protein